MPTGAPGQGGKCPAGQGQHPHVGWVSAYHPLQPWPGFRPWGQQKQPFLLSCSTAGLHWAGPVCVVQLCLSTVSTWVLGRESDQGSVGSFLLPKLQGFKDQLSAPSAALRLPGKQVLPWACPSVPTLSWALGQAAQASCPRVAAGVPKQDCSDPVARAVPMTVCGAGDNKNNRTN